MIHVYQLFNMSICFSEKSGEAGRDSILLVKKSDEGADTDLMFKFCLPNRQFLKYLKFPN